MVCFSGAVVMLSMAAKVLDLDSNGLACNNNVAGSSTWPAPAVQQLCLMVTSSSYHIGFARMHSPI